MTEPKGRQDTVVGEHTIGTHSQMDTFSGTDRKQYLNFTPAEEFKDDLPSGNVVVDHKAMKLVKRDRNGNETDAVDLKGLLEGTGVEEEDESGDIAGTEENAPLPDHEPPENIAEQK